MQSCPLPLHSSALSLTLLCAVQFLIGTKARPSRGPPATNSAWERGGSGENGWSIHFTESFLPAEGGLGFSTGGPASLLNPSHLGQGIQPSTRTALVAGSLGLSAVSLENITLLSSLPKLRRVLCCVLPQGPHSYKSFSVKQIGRVCTLFFIRNFFTKEFSTALCVLMGYNYEWPEADIISPLQFLHLLPHFFHFCILSKYLLFFLVVHSIYLHTGKDKSA